MANQPDYVNSAALATMIALTSLATVGAALAVTALVRSEQQELAAIREEPMSRDVRSLRAEQERQLNADPAWVDREKGLVSLPIDKAMELTLQDIRRGRTVVGARKAEEEETEETEGADAEEADTEEAESEEGAEDESSEKEPSDTTPSGAAEPGGQPAAPGTAAPPSAPGAPQKNGQQSGGPASPQKAPGGPASSPGSSGQGAPGGGAPAPKPAPKGAEPPQEAPGR